MSDAAAGLFEYLPIKHAGSSFMPNRQERILTIPVNRLVELVAGTSYISLPPEIPSDAISLRTFQDDSTNSICVVVYHSSFSPIAQGFTIPRYNVVVNPIPVLQLKEVNKEEPAPEPPAPPEDIEREV